MIVFSPLTHLKHSIPVNFNVLSSQLLLTIVPVTHEFRAISFDEDASSVGFVCFCGPLSDVLLVVVKAVLLLLIAVFDVSRSKLRIN